MAAQQVGGLLGHMKPLLFFGGYGRRCHHEQSPFHILITLI